MPANWREFQPDPENNTGPPPVGTGPEGNFAGNLVNNILRNVAAAIRNLGDETAKIDPAKGMTGETKIGTAALRDESAFVVRGTGVTGFGIVPIGVILPFFGTMAQAEALLSGGYAVCDGRTVTVPGTNTLRTMPDVRGLYARFSGVTDGPTTVTGQQTATTASSGAHDHAVTVASGGAGTTGSGGGGSTGSAGAATTSAAGGGTTGSGGGGSTGSSGAGNTGSTALIEANLPAGVVLDAVVSGAGGPRNIESGGDLALTLTETGPATGHTHTVSAHTHTVSAHTHSLDDHTHTVGNHTHTVSAHTHSIPDHTHSASAASAGAHTHTVSLFPRCINLVPVMRIA